jgi:hypothetical protein
MKILMSVGRTGRLLGTADLGTKEERCPQGLVSDNCVGSYFISKARAYPVTHYN